MMMGGGSSKVLNYISDFAIWNNTKADLVSFGHIERSAQNNFFIVVPGVVNARLAGSIHR
jgi:hypothetical protein